MELKIEVKLRDVEMEVETKRDRELRVFNNFFMSDYMIQSC